MISSIFFSMLTIGNQEYNVQSLNRDMIKKMMFHKISLPISLLLLLISQTVQATNNVPQATSSFSEMISNIMALSNTELVVISDYNSEIKVMMKLN